MELKEAIIKITEGKIVFDKNTSGAYFFLFGRENIIYYVNDHKINNDKMELAIKNNNRPSLLASGWWENKWEVYDYDKQVNEEVDEKVESVKKIIKDIRKNPKAMAQVKKLLEDLD